MSIKRVQYTQEELDAASKEITARASGKESIEVANPTVSTAEILSPPAVDDQPAVSASIASTPISDAGNPVTREVLPPPRPRDVVNVRSGNEVRPLIPTTIDEVYRFARMLALTYNLPAAYYARPKTEVGASSSVNVEEMATMRAIHAMQIGAEVGIPPAQAVQSILILNGVGTIWGDAQLGLVLASGKCEYVKEYTENSPMMLEDGQPNPIYTWVFETKRKGAPEPAITKFSVADSIKAGLWGKQSQYGKPSPWVTHPDRMGKYKVRAFGCRDSYADVLKGLCHSREEFEGETIEQTPEGSKVTSDISTAELAAKLNNSAAA